VRRTVASLACVVSAAVAIRAVAQPAPPTTAVPITRPAALPEFRSGRTIRGECEGRPCIALTFDDGPDDVITPQVLDELDRHHVHATFFIVGRRISGRTPLAARNRAVLLETQRRGHWIGNHTFNHPSMDTLDDAALSREIDMTARAIEVVIGVRTPLFRPPYGAFHNDASVRAVFSRRMTPVLWQLDSRDWAVHRPEQVVANFRAALDASPAGGVVLFHDTHAHTAAALPQIFAEVETRNTARRGRGEAPYEFVGLEELWHPMHPARRRRGAGDAAADAGGDPNAADSSRTDATWRPQDVATDATWRPQDVVTDASTDGGFVGDSSVDAPVDAARTPSAAMVRPAVR